MAYVTGLTKKATQGHGLSLGDLMNEDRLAGTARNLGGKAEEGVGRVTGNIKEQVQEEARPGGWGCSGSLRADRGCGAGHRRHF